jgi:hypothetical protein
MTPTASCQQWRSLLCHPDRSAAEWKDLPHVKLCRTYCVILTGAQRSGRLSPMSNCAGLIVSS